MLATIVILCIVGLLLVFAEIFVPGAILGILGGLLLIGAIVASYYEYGFGIGSLLLVAISILSLTSLALGLRVFPRTPLGRQLQLQTSLDSPGETPDFHALVGREGVALTNLRPSGTARIGNQRVDVVSHGALIEKGTPIRVVQTERLRVVVRAIGAQEDTAANDSASI